MVKPLHGIPKSVLHWYLTYLAHHLKVIYLQRARSDRCVLIREKREKINGLILLQVDDSLDRGTNGYLQDEKRASKVLRSRPRVSITSNQTKFRGLTIKRNHEGVFFTTQEDKIKILSKKSTQKELSSSRSLARYVGVCVRPYVCAPVQLIAPGNTSSTEARFKALHKSTGFLRKTDKQRLNFVTLYIG